MTEKCGCGEDHSKEDHDKQKQLQTKYMEYQMLEQQLQQVQQHLQKMEEQLGEVSSVKEALDDLDKKQKGSEVLVPISNGIFFQAEKGASDKFLVNIGANIVVEKDSKGTKELIDGREAEITKYKAQLTDEMMKMVTQYQELEKELQTLVNN